MVNRTALLTQPRSWVTLLSLPSLNPSGLLPPGDHEASWNELDRAFGTNFKRKDLMVNLHHTVKSLVDLGVTEIYIDGSFVTAKERPRDVEVIYVPPSGADTSTWGLFSFGQHEMLKRMHKIDLWPYPSPQPTVTGWVTIKDFFSTDRDGTPKGIIRLNLEGFS
ncbi:DUF6932 family protein [Kitasatospora sp. NPDC093550]|uniref:DUF6932 family protein n=1 Tax=Kitasatospora sp. NPDC093550 TaxID=3364089 RepID=UPI00382061C2